MGKTTKIVHIGYHKTGTTFLQDVLFPSHPEVMFIDRMTTQKLLLRIGSLHFNPKKVKENIMNLVAECETNNKRAIVFSDEELSGNIHTGGNGGYLAKEVADRIYSVMPDAKIVISIRNQLSMINSVYRQYIKKGGTLPLKKYLFDNGGAHHRFPQFRFEHFEYDKLISYYYYLFGKENVHVHLYEEAKEDDEFYNKMLEDLNLSSFNSVTEVAATTVNPSYSNFSLGLSRFFNRFYGADPINKRCVIHIPYLHKIIKKILYKLELSGKTKGKSFKMDAKTIEFIKKYYKESNQRLINITDINISDYNYPL